MVVVILDVVALVVVSVDGAAVVVDGVVADGVVVVEVVEIEAVVSTEDGELIPLVTLAFVASASVVDFTSALPDTDEVVLNSNNCEDTSDTNT